MGSLPQLSILKGPTRPLVVSQLGRIFEKVAAGPAASNIALIFEENGQSRQLSYSQVDQITNKFARVISETIKTKNLKPNSDGDHIIAVNMHPSDHLILVLLSIWKSGCAYLPLDHSFPASRIDHIIQESKPVIVIYDEDSKNFPAKLSYEELLTASDGRSDKRLEDKERVYQKDDLAIVLYTSGSTGIPKGVRIPHKIILNRLQWQFKTFPFSETEKVCVFKTALTFVDSVCEIWGPLISGISILIVPKSVTLDPEKLIQKLDDYKIERLVLVPSLLRSILMCLELKKNRTLLKNLKLWVCSGETLTTSLAEEFFRYFPENEYKLCNFYGSTEIMGDVTFYIISGMQQLKNLLTVPIGAPVDNTIVYLLDPELRPVKTGDIGELFVSGLNLASGYVNNRDKEKFLENQLAIDPIFSKLYRTGDFARLQNDVLLYEGRTDSQVKIRGHRVDLSEVEKAVSGVEGVEKAVVLCYQPGEMNQALLAFVKSSALMNENQIENILRSKLTSYMVPQVILVESIPLLVNGKIDRQALLKSYENTNNNDDSSVEIEIDYSGVKPAQMAAAKVLFDTVASVLNRSARSAISLDSNFYEIGGNSLNSIYTITRLNEEGYQISIGDFLSAIDLGEVLERMTSSNDIHCSPPTYTSELLKNEHKSAVLDIITTSFYQKADLEQWLMPDIFESDYKELMDALWEPLVEKALSFVAKAESGKIIGVGLNFDARDEPDVQITSKLTVIFEFLETVEGPVRDKCLPGGKGKILHSFMMGTHSSLSPKENVAVMQFMEDEVLKLATERHFEGIFTTNTSPLTQQLGTDVYHYQTLLDYQVNRYVASDNTRPFGMAPDSQRAIVQWKPIKSDIVVDV
ncbi:beta-alanyl-bioamine nonribosomal peptide synthetase ebony isoform X2 [Tribolium castaneum]|uniref:Mycosubtilin synthase subunit C-like Protein n=1 Tax=Tribolium castaneum TaxID=7070 RepID=D6X2S1_TRICA|nr:PREDICTED: mycosubtilin synthase subunit C [Tribolium castaneum]EFA09829.1 Mycosubtilin synthase subunit C-like Protein [Tribolium castaneum]|eukprot:XP_008197905.1 PREDICTED: mycosubtilin synthase subunit C [Tribolium castaneum]